MARQRHDRTRIEAWLRRRERRGLSYAELSEQSGVPVATLAWWAGKLRREASRDGPGFVEVGPVGGDDLGRIEILLRNGRQLIVREGIRPEALVALLAAVDGPC